MSLILRLSARKAHLLVIPSVVCAGSSGGGFEAGVDVVGFEPIRFTHQLVGFCLWMPVPVSTTRTTLIDHSRALVAEVEPGQGLGSAMDLAEGDTFVYSTANRAGETTPGA